MGIFLRLLQEHLNKTLPESPSPFGRWLNPIVRKAEPGEFELEFIVRQEMTNPAGTVHGGVIAAMLDETIGIMMFCLSEPNFKASINLVTDFLSPAKTGDQLLVKARVTKQGRNLFHGVAEMYRITDMRLIATGSSHMYSKTSAENPV